jgi:hypothetical protein
LFLLDGKRSAAGSSVSLRDAAFAAFKRRMKGTFR